MSLPLGEPGRVERDPYAPPGVAPERREAALLADDLSGFERLMDGPRHLAVRGFAGAATALLVMVALVPRRGCGGTDALGTAIAFGGVAALLALIISGQLSRRSPYDRPNNGLSKADYPERADP